MTKLYTALISLSLLAGGCKTASKSYQRGDYTEAIELGVKKLQKDAGDQTTRHLVQQSYDYSVNEREEAIRALSNSKGDDRYEKIYQQYAALQHLYAVIHQYPAVSQLINARDYGEYVATYRDKAADAHLERAMKWMSEGTKEAAREGYREFNAALYYRPDDFEMRRKRDEAYEAAVTRVILSPLQSYGGRYGRGDYQLQEFQRDIVRTLARSINNEFVKFYSEFDARSNDITPDQILELNLSRINIGQPFDSRTTREVSKEVVLKEIVYKPDSVVKQYGTVKARITTTKRSLLSQGDLFITLRDTRGRTLWTDRFTGEHKWQTEFVTYTGDERALSESDKNQVNQNQQTPPTEEGIMDELLRQIQNDLTYRLRTYYTRYQ